jgi:hypothetical protein
VDEGPSVEVDQVNLLETIQQSPEVDVVGVACAEDSEPLTRRLALDEPPHLLAVPGKRAP